MKKLAILVFLISFITVFGGSDNTVHYVLAKSGLYLRAKANIDAKKITVIPYGTKLSFIDNGKNLKQYNSENYKGHWRKVTYKGKTGFIFDGFTSRFPAPQYESLKDYMKIQLKAKLDSTVKNPENIEKYDFKGGLIMYIYSHDNGVETMVFNGGTIQEVF